MRMTIQPGKALGGVAQPPGDKSLSHRAALLAALAQGESCFENFLVAGVTRPLLSALRALGIEWTLTGTEDDTTESEYTATLVVQGVGIDGLRAPAAPLDCGNSATVLRLLAGALAAAGTSAVLDGSTGLRRRPMGRIVEPLSQMGVSIKASAGGTAPLTLAGRAPSQPLQPMIYHLPVASAQVKSCLLLAALAADGPTTLIEPGPSRDHTERMLRSMGACVYTEVRHAEYGQGPAYAVTIRPSDSARNLAPLQLSLPGDFSSAAFLIVAALITPGSAVRLLNVGLNPTRTGLLDALNAMGAQIEVTGLAERGGEPVGDLFIRHSPLQATNIDGNLVVRMIDEFPAFAIAAAFAQGSTVVREATELRHKESDRIAALGGEFRKLGIPFHETPDGFAITGGQPIGEGRVASHGDHRLAMALALAGLAGGGKVTVDGAEVLSESFPNFGVCLQRLGAEIHLED